MRRSIIISVFLDHVTKSLVHFNLSTSLLGYCVAKLCLFRPQSRKLFSPISLCSLTINNVVLYITLNIIFRFLYQTSTPFCFLMFHVSLPAPYPKGESNIWSNYKCVIQTCYCFSSLPAWAAKLLICFKKSWFPIIWSSSKQEITTPVHIHMGGLLSEQ